MQVAQFNFVGPKSTPQEIQDLRRSSLDFHTTYGQPVVHKHRWNEIDVEKGLAQYCPYDHEDTTGRSRQWDEICFGTGYVGGFADGIVAYITFADAPMERLKLGPSGTLVYEREPAFTAPWIPELGDGDMIITGTFTRNHWEIMTEDDRFILHEVTPVTMRGFENDVRGRIDFLVNQSGQVEKLPRTHQFYSIPIEFDYENLSPDIYPDGALTSTSFGLRITGRGGQKSNQSNDIRITALGNDSATTTGLRIRGISEDVHVILT